MTLTRQSLQILKAIPSPCLIMLADAPLFTTVGVNDPYLELTGTKRSDLIGKGVSRIFPENEKEEAGTEALLEKLMATKTPQTKEKLDQKHCFHKYFPVFGEKGEVEFILDYPTDASEKVLTEQKTRLALEELQKETEYREIIQQKLSIEKDLADSLINSLPGIFYLFDKEGKFHRWNKNFETITGYTSDEIKHMQPTDFHLDENYQFALNEIEEIFTKGKAEFEAPLRFKDGRRGDFMFNAMAITLNNRNFIIGTALDITDRLKVEEQVQSSLQEKKVLLNEVHHRVKNNLAVINGLISLQTETVKDDKLRTMLMETESRIQSMSMIHEMLYQQQDFSKVQFEPYVINLFGHISKNFQSSSQKIFFEVHAKDIFFDLHIAIPCALIINELLTNAFKHAFVGRKTGSILVELSHNEGLNTLQVIDNGIGYPRDINTGATLGMSLIYGLASQIGGSVSIDTDNGTSITIEFATQNSMAGSHKITGT